MSFRRSLVLCSLVFLTARGTLRAQDRSEPCSHEYAAAFLLGNLHDIAMTTDELRLLNGKEDPKLRRFLEYRLSIAAADARRHVDETPNFNASYLPSFVSGVDRALRYVTAHPFDQKALEQLHVAMPAANLEYVRAWVAKQPWARPRSAAPTPN